MVNHNQVIADLIGRKPATALPADYSLGSKSFEKLFGKDSVERKNCLIHILGDDQIKGREPFRPTAFL